MENLFDPVHLGYHQGPLLSMWLTLIPAWISNYIYYEVLNEITHIFLNFNGATVEVWEWISNFTPQFTGHVIIYRCRKIHFSKRGLRSLIEILWICKMFLHICIINICLKKSYGMHITIEIIGFIYEMIYSAIFLQNHYFSRNIII